MRGHLQCRDTLAGNEGCPLKTGRVAWGMTAPLRENGIFDMIGSR